MRARGWLSGVFVLGLSTSACGHIPGYYPEGHGEPERVVSTPKAPPAPPRAVRRAADVDDRSAPADDSYGDDEGYAEFDEGASEGDEPDHDESPSRPGPRPPRYTPPPTWEPPASPQPASPTQPRTAPPARPTTPAAPSTTPPPQPQTAEGVKVIRLDADTYYLVDAVRNLCFLRHKESMTAVDCARLAAQTPPAPARTEPPPAAPAPASPSRGPASPTPDETVRFEAAFTDIFCDRKGRDDTPPETRIQARGLSVQRYEAIESWWASDENAWFTLTQRAARGCRR